MEVSILKFALKNKKNIIIAVLAIIITGVVLVFTIKKEIKFSNYVSTIVLNPISNFSNNSKNTVFKTEFKILNLNDGPFVITNVYSDDDIDFLETRIKKIIDTCSITTIQAKVITNKKGEFLKTIFVESNSKDGVIKLQIVGN